MTADPIRVLFLCTHNSARSQMAEALLRHHGGAHVAVASAGTEPMDVHPLAVRVMDQVGIDIAQARAKHCLEFLGQEFDYIITTCDRVRESCPTFPGDPTLIHWSFLDPTSVDGDEDERLRAFARVRDELNQRLRLFILANVRATRQR